MGRIKILVMDVDGTLTDGKIYMGPMGEVHKAFDIKDGYAIYSMLPEAGIIPVIITGRESEILKRRCEELGIRELYQNCVDKKKKMYEIIDRFGMKSDENGVIRGCAYIGDDVLDIPGMNISEVSGCPSDAVEEVKNCAAYICNHKGGDGAVREFIEWILREYDI